MRLFLSVHAVQQMKERGISRDEVADVVENPHTVYTSEESESLEVLLGETSTGVPLKVVVRAYDRTYIVTAARRDREE